MLFRVIDNYNKTIDKSMWFSEKFKNLLCVSLVLLCGNAYGESSMNQKNYRILLEWYNKKSGTLVSDEEIILTEDELSSQLKLEKPLPYIGTAYQIERKDEVDSLQSLLKHSIKLKEYDYFIISRSIDGVRQEAPPFRPPVNLPAFPSAKRAKPVMKDGNRYTPRWED